MNGLEFKRLERNLHSTKAYLDRPIYQHLLVNTLVWSIIMGPIIFFITNYDRTASIPWGELPRSMVIFGVGGIVYTFFMQLFHKWLKSNLEKKLRQQKGSIEEQ